MIKPQFEGTYSDLSAMMVSSVRYALGRQTYIVELTTKFIGDNLKILTDKDLYVMKRDIEESIEYGIAGSEIDVLSWEKLLNRIKRFMKKKRYASTLKKYMRHLGITTRVFYVRKENIFYVRMVCFNCKEKPD